MGRYENRLEDAIMRVLSDVDRCYGAYLRPSGEGSARGQRDFFMPLATMLVAAGDVLRSKFTPACLRVGIATQ